MNSNSTSNISIFIWTSHFQNFDFFLSRIKSVKLIPKNMTTGSKVSNLGLREGICSIILKCPKIEHIHFRFFSRFEMNMLDFGAFQDFRGYVLTCKNILHAFWDISRNLPYAVKIFVMFASLRLAHFSKSHVTIASSALVKMFKLFITWSKLDSYEKYETSFRLGMSRVDITII